MKTEEKSYTLMDYYKSLKYRNTDKESADLAKGMMALIEKSQAGKMSKSATNKLLSMLNDFVVLSDEKCGGGNSKFVVEKINVPKNLRDYFLSSVDKQTTKKRNSTKTNKRHKCKLIHNAQVCRSAPAFNR